MSDRSIDIRDSDAGGEGRESSDDRSIGQLFGELSREFSDLMRQEVQLAKTELREEAGKAGKAAGQLTGAAVAAHMALLLLSLAAAWALDEIMHLAVALLIVGVVHGVVAAVLYRQGRRQVAEITPIPDETVETLKEDAEWAKQQLK